MKAQCPKLPTLTRFITFLQDYNEEKHHAARTIEIRGPKTRKKKYQISDRRIYSAITEYLTFEDDKKILNFLNRIQYSTIKFAAHLAKKGKLDEVENDEIENDEVENDDSEQQ